MTHGKIFTLALLVLVAATVSCGGGGMNASPVLTPTPASTIVISSVTPDTAVVATPVTVQVTGSGFDSSSVITFDGKPSTTTVVSSSLVTTSVPADAVSQPTDVNVVVSSTSTKQDSNALKIRWVKPLTITTTSVANATVGSSYQATLAASGGKSPYSWTASAGIPAGMSLSASGTLSGIPTTAGSYALNVEVTDSSSPAKTASATISLTVSTEPLTVSASGLANATVNKSYSSSLSAKGGSLPYGWSVTSGSLPPGLSLASTTGVISGTATVTGTFNFTVSVSDNSNPTQKQSAATSIIVASNVTPVSITSSTLPAGVASTSYNATLSATGGTPAYTWSVASGSLPAGLSLNSATGVVSGTPSASGTYNLTVSVADSSNPAQTQSAATSIVVAPALAIGAGSLPSGTVNSNYSATVQATGGTPAYTWSVASGQLPSGLTLAATTGEISGTPSAAGTYSFTLKVTDNGSPAQTVTTAQTIAIGAAQTASAGTMWYVRPDGGTRYSANVLTGQCDGKSDAAYPGTGTNQHCAFNDVRYLWADGSYANGTAFPAWGWVIAGGDTVIVRGGPWRVGYSGPNNTAADYKFGIAGNPYASGAPAIPSGTSAQHTRILGENYASCAASSAKTQLFGGYGADSVLSLKGSQYVDVQCLDLTDHAQCTRSGATGQQYPYYCSSNSPRDDYAKWGIVTSTGTSDILLQDLNIHGFTSRGIIGPLGGTLTTNRVRIGFNGGAGWDFDDGAGTKSVNNATATNSYLTIEWNGCNEEYPITHANPAISCYDQSSAGYGDAVGTPDGPLNFSCDHCTIRYNTQDGLDLLHTTGSATTITNSQSYGNMGQQWKLGPMATVTFRNNLTVHDCHRLSAPVGDVPSTFNTYLTNFCRAAGDGIAMTVTNGGTYNLQGNTYIGYGATLLDIQCATTGCATANVQVQDNIIVGYPSPVSGNQANTYYLATGVPAIKKDHNLYYNTRTCATDASGTNERCMDPGLQNIPMQSFVEADFDSFDFHLTPWSPAQGAGVNVDGLTTDYSGTRRTTPPDIGAYQYVQ